MRTQNTLVRAGRRTQPLAIASEVTGNRAQDFHHKNSGKADFVAPKISQKINKSSEFFVMFCVVR